MISARFPLAHGVCASLAGSLCLTLGWLPSQPWYPFELRADVLSLSISWALWRVYCFERALTAWRAWHISPAWEITPEALTRQ